MDDLARQGIPAEVATDGVHVHAHVPEAPSAGVDITCTRDGVSWIFASERGAALDSVAEAVNYVVWLLGARYASLPAGPRR